MIRFETKSDLARACNFKVASSADAMRLNSAWETYNLRLQVNADSAFGYAAEILSRRPNSRKTTVSSQGKADISVMIDGKLISAECKTNGGRIASLSGGMTGAYIVYTLNIKNSTGEKSITPRIMRKDTFVNKLYEFNAVKEVRHGGKVDGLAIQPSNRKLWAWLEEQLEYFHDWEYFSEDFE